MLLILGDVAAHRALDQERKSSSSIFNPMSSDRWQQRKLLIFITKNKWFRSLDSLSLHGHMAWSRCSNRDPMDAIKLGISSSINAMICCHGECLSSLKKIGRSLVVAKWKSHKNIYLSSDGCVLRKTIDLSLFDTKVLESLDTNGFKTLFQFY